MYAIVDIETTGGSPVSEKITEIAIYIFDGEKIVDEFISLVNPERKIPYYITQLTGITNTMVADAPRFYEIARKIVEITEGKTFVAHNVNFDYNFIRNEFKQLGYDFQREKLCTVNLSRKIIPGYRSYSLGALCNETGIEINGRHRASGDAFATVKLFELLLSKSNNPEMFSSLPGISLKDLHPNLDPQLLKNIPENAGVYYFYNDKNELIYIGKSKNIRSRLLSHFRNTRSKKAIEMRNAICSTDYELTGNELIALLKESYEIKQNKPHYNRAQRRALAQYGIYTYIDSCGYIRFETAKHNNNNQVPLCSFTSKKAANLYLEGLSVKYRLCRKLCGLYQAAGACFYFEIKECNGACIGQESSDKYNSRAQYVIEQHRFRHQSFFIVEKGRSDNELAVVKVNNGKYIGYGYFDKYDYDNNAELMNDCIRLFPDDRDIQQILRNYLRTGKPLDIVKF
ncbi:MAG: GIY-YIG nuclease family protein [Bacteroidales bacterium]|nr:GIY-YIG nuclease family protein [Bacteroidales bacterium]